MKNFQLKHRIYHNRKRILASFIIILCLSGFSQFPLLLNTFTTAKAEPAYTTKITAHRGNVTQAVENTLEAIQIAANQHADYAEIDIQLSKDGQLFVFHDPTFNRMAGLDKKTSELTYKEISELDLTHYSHGKLEGKRIPLFKEVVALAKKNKLQLNVEIKPNADPEVLAQQAVAILKEYKYDKKSIITSANHRVLEEIKKADKKMKTGLITSAVPDLKKLDVDLISIQQKAVTKDLITEAHALGKEVHVWTVNDKESMKQLILMGVDSIITNKVVDTQNVLASLN